MRRIRDITRDRRGGTAIEYTLILAMIVLVILGSLRLVASQTTNMYNNISNRVVNASNA